MAGSLAPRVVLSTAAGAQLTSSAPGREPYDVAVVGAGLAGLTAGALLARAGQRIVVLEADSRTGGWARGIEADGYSIDPAVHLIMGGASNGPFGPRAVDALLELLGVGDRCALSRVEPVYTACLPGLTLSLPSGREAFLSTLSDAFPSERRGFRRLAELTGELFAESLDLPIRPRPIDWLAMPVRQPKLMRHSRSTLAGAVQRRLADPRARAVYSALWPYAGLPPKRLSFGVWAIMMGGFIDHGAYYCAGGFQRLADAVAAGFVEHGGELALGRRVSEIRVDRKRVVGVVTDEGDLIRARCVVASGDARSTFGALISPAARPRRTARRVKRDPTSMSVLALYVGTDIDIASLGVAQETIVYRSWDHEANYDAALAGAGTAVTVTVPTLADPSLAPSGRHLVGIAGPAPRAGSQNARAVIAAEFVALAERVIPGLGDRIEFALGSDAPAGESPELTLHEHGPIYGWATTPAMSGPFRLPQWTPIEGLYLAGHWTQPGHGIWTVMLSGLRAARLVLDRGTSRGVSSPLL